MAFWVIMGITAWFLVGYLNVRFVSWFDKRCFLAKSFDTPSEVYLWTSAGPLGMVLVVLVLIIMLALKIADAIHSHVKQLIS